MKKRTFAQIMVVEHIGEIAIATTMTIVGKTKLVKGLGLAWLVSSGLLGVYRAYKHVSEEDDFDDVIL